MTFKLRTKSHPFSIKYIYKLHNNFSYNSLKHLLRYTNYGVCNFTPL